MKKFWKYMMIFAAAVAIAPLTACDDNDEVDPYDINYAYFYQPNEDYSNIEFKATGDFISSLNDPLSLTPVKLTKAAPGNVEITVGVDASLVDEYNKANGTNYKLMEGASIVNPKMIIEAGTYQSAGPIEVTFDHQFLVNNTSDLILPIAITSVSNSSIVISKSARTFLIFNYQANKVSLINRSIEVGSDQAQWADMLTNPELPNMVWASWAADEPITVNLEIDNSLIAKYNADNGMDFIEMPGVQLSQKSVTIAQGETMAPVGLKISDYSQITTGYVVPVRITSVDGVGSGIDEDADVAYIVVCTQMPAGVSVTSAPGTVLTPGDNWVVKVDGQTELYEEEYDETTVWSDLLTGYASNYINEGKVVEIDLGEAMTVSGFRMDFYAWYYAYYNLAKLETSTDGSRWKNWGSVNFGSSNGGRNYSIVEFTPTAPTCRYIRFTAGRPSYSSSYGTYMTMLSIYGE